MNKYSELYDLVTSLKDDFEKFYDKKNKAAGTRVRKGMQDVGAWAKSVRAEVQAIEKPFPFRSGFFSIYSIFNTAPHS
jgi:hypothetical protein